MKWFRPLPPPAGLRGVVECTWDASPEGRHDLVPDGSVELLWIDGRGIWVCGPDTTGWSFTLPPGTATTGVRFHPGASGSALGLTAAELVDRRVPLDEVLSDRIARLQRFIRLAAEHHSGLAELAACAGYADQAHLTRDCNDLAAMTPGRLVSTLERTSAVIRPLDDRSVQDRLAS